MAYFHYGIFKGGDSNGWYRTFELAKGLVKLGHQVDLFTTGMRSKYGKLSVKNIDDVKVCVFGDIFSQRFQRGGFAFSTIFRKINFAKNSDEYDLVISDNIHRPSCLVPSFYLKIFKGVPLISEWWELFGKGGIFTDLGWSHKLTVGLYDLLFEKSIRKRCNGIVAISNYLKEEAQSMGFDSNIIEVIHAGSQSQLCEEEYSDLTEPADELKIGLIGFNKDELINNVYLFEAVKNLRSSGRNVKITCSGDKNLQSIIPEEYKPFVELLGWIEYSEFVKEFNSCHVLALLQQNKIRNIARFPNKFGDYMSFRGIVLTNAIGDISEYVIKYPEKVKFANSIRGVLLILESIIDDGMPIIGSSICRENSWEVKAKQLLNLYIRINRISDY